MVTCKFKNYLKEMTSFLDGGFIPNPSSPCGSSSGSQDTSVPLRKGCPCERVAIRKPCRGGRGRCTPESCPDKTTMFMDTRCSRDECLSCSIPCLIPIFTSRGLPILDENGSVVSFNPATGTFLDSSNNTIEQPFFDRSGRRVTTPFYNQGGEIVFRGGLMGNGSTSTSGVFGTNGISTDMMMNGGFLGTGTGFMTSTGGSFDTGSGFMTGTNGGFQSGSTSGTWMNGGGGCRTGRCGGGGGGGHGHGNGSGNGNGNGNGGTHHRSCRCFVCIPEEPQEPEEPEEDGPRRRHGRSCRCYVCVPDCEEPEPTPTPTPTPSNGIPRNFQTTTTCYTVSTPLATLPMNITGIDYTSTFGSGSGSGLGSGSSCLPCEQKKKKSSSHKSSSRKSSSKSSSSHKKHKKDCGCGN